MATAAPPAEGLVFGLPPRLFIGFVAMIFGMFMAILDIQIVASSLSEIQAGLGATPEEIGWVQTSYLIAEIVMIPLSGILSRLLSTRVLFVASAVSFTAASALCATAGSLEQMMLYRALQGFLGGAMIPTVFAASFMLFPGARRAQASVVMGLVATMAPTLGPTLGGWITQTLSWHWLFLLNIVPGVLVALTVWRTIDIDEPDRSVLKGFDVPGLLMMAAFLGSLEYVLDEGPRSDWFDDRAVLWLSVVCVVGGIGFFWRVLTYDRPIVDITAFKDRNFAVGCLYSFIIGVGLYGSVYVMPLFLGRVRGYDALEIGKIMFVTGAFQMLSAPLAGRLANVLPGRVMLATGLVLFGTGVYLNSILTSQTAFWDLFLPQAVRGMALMFLFVPINSIALGTLPPDRLKNASGLYNLMRNLGGAIGLAVINTVLLHREAVHAARLVENLNPTRPEVRAVLDGLSAHFEGRILGDPDAAALRAVTGIVERQVLVLSYSDCLLLMASVFFLALLLLPLLRPPRAQVGGGH